MTPFLRRRPFFILSIFTLIVASCQVESKEDKLPNIIIMLADDLGYNDLSCYRDESQDTEFAPTCETPFLDNLAEEGIRFTNFYCGAAVCSPSRSALITGRNKTRLGIYNWVPWNSPMHLRTDETTIAEMLKQKNYLTGHFGKWHLTSEGTEQPQPIDQGFDYAFWTYNNAIPSHKNPVNFISNRDEVGELKGYSSHLVVERAMKWLDEVSKEPEPFYMNVWFHEPHSVEAAPDSLVNRHKRNGAYYGCIENMDLAVGKLMDYLRRNKLDENTIILFSSDNGSEKRGSNAPLRGSKCFQYEGGVRVPFIAYWKDKIHAGTISENISHFTDVLPTIAGITECAAPDNKIIDGQDIQDVLLGKAKELPRKEPLFFYRYFHDPICMLREGDMVMLGYLNQPKPRQEDYNVRKEALFKPKEGEAAWSQWSFCENHMDSLLVQEPRYFELYNVKADPGQYNNIVAEHADLTEHMKSAILQLRKEMVAEGGNWFENEKPEN